MSLRVWLPLNGDLHNLGISNHTIALTNGNTWTSPGKIGNNALTLTKLLLIVPSTSCMSGAKEISYAYWIKVNTAWSNDWLDGIRWIETDGSATSTARQEFYTNCTLIGTWYKGGAISGKAFTPGVWTHLAGTFNYNTGEAKFYINGVLSGSTTNINTAYYCRGDFCIGDNGVDICENDVRIYDHCLSAAEVREIALGLILHYKLDDITNDIKDSSGYGHNGKILNSPLTIINDLPRYSQGIKFTATNKKIEITDLITAGFGNSYSFAWWAKVNSLSPMHWGFKDGIRLNGMYTGRLWNTADSSNNPLYNPGTTTQVSAPSINTWHHWVMTGNGTKCYVYLDGILWGEAKTYKAINGNTIYINGWDTSTSYSSTDLSISDFRIYCTALSAEDVLQLYHTNAKVDNKGNLHTFALNEDENKINKLTKSGIFYNLQVEYIKLSDDSKWELLMYHEVKGGSNLFPRAEAGHCNKSGLYSRLDLADNFTYNNKYEFLVLLDDKLFRWTLTSKPSASSISGLTTVSGNPVHGLAKATANNSAYFGYGSWWGACGSWTSYSSGGKTGIPAFGNTNADGICTQYLALYARVNSTTNRIADGVNLSNSFIEF